MGDAAKKNGLKIIAGVYIRQGGTGTAQDEVKALTQWAQWDQVNFVVIGNEAIKDSYTTAGELASFIKQVKDTLQKAGYKGGVTTADILGTWQNGKELCDAVDIVGANLHPYYDPNATPETAGDVVMNQLGQLGGVCGGKETYNLETGWPNGGNSNGKAITGEQAQKIAIKAIAHAAGEKSVFFSFQDDPWKGGGVEAHWGSINAFA